MWECKKCRERVENSFDVCWNCGTSREGVEDPGFRPESDEAAPEPQAKAKPPAKKPRRAVPALTVTTGNEVSGRLIASYLGIVRGVVVRSPGIMQGFLGGLKQMVGGNIEVSDPLFDRGNQRSRHQYEIEAHEDEPFAMVGKHHCASPDWIVHARRRLEEERIGVPARPGKRDGAPGSAAVPG